MWNADLTRELKFESKDDGVFFISFEDYLNFFYVTSICRYQKDGDLSVKEDEHKIGGYCIQRFSVP